MTLKEQWIEALTGGKYQQGSGFLRTKGDEADKFCCLGVLADIIDSKGWSDTDPYPQEGDSFHWLSDSDELLPATVLTRSIQQTLATKNDEGNPFTDIADWIKVNVKDEDIHLPE